eukprot:m.458534 g.458534  ORF g.458534 m.458534 type:complete len:80 (-) comp216871_c0_seq1:195-434(-)
MMNKLMTKLVDELQIDESSSEISSGDNATLCPRRPSIPLPAVAVRDLWTHRRRLCPDDAKCLKLCEEENGRRCPTYPHE